MSVFRQILVTFIILAAIAGGGVFYFTTTVNESISSVPRKQRAVGVEVTIARQGIIGAGAVILGDTVEKGVYMSQPAERLPIESDKLSPP